MGCGINAHNLMVALFFETTKRCQVTGIVLSRLRTGGEEGKGVLAATLKPLREESKRESERESGRESERESER